MTSKEAFKPIVAITMGDPAGIGPEIAVKALQREDIYAISRPLLVGDAAVFNQMVVQLKAKLNVHAIRKVEDAIFNYGTIDVIDLQNVQLHELRFGEVSAMAGNASFEAVKKAIDLAMNGEVQATVTGPINKKSINEAGHHFAGHTEIYAHFTGTKKYAMLLVEDKNARDPCINACVAAPGLRPGKERPHSGSNAIVARWIKTFGRNQSQNRYCRPEPACWRQRFIRNRRR
jgi:Pyridoxal phosphate biosynthesis protein